MLTNRGALIDFVPPDIGDHQSVNQLNAHATTRKIGQESMTHLRPLKNIYDATVDLNFHNYQLSIINC